MIGIFSIVKQEVPMTQEKVSPLRERMIPSRDIAEQYPVPLPGNTCAVCVRGGSGRYAYSRDGR
jgi:hypothetical protein